MRFCFLVFFITVAYSCTLTPDIELGEFQDYLPSKELLYEGVVNKYYEHFEPGEGRQPYSNILYRKYKAENDYLRESTYNAGMELIEEKVFQVDYQGWELLSHFRINQGDTVNAAILESIYIDLDSSSSSSFMESLPFSETYHLQVKRTQRSISKFSLEGEPILVQEIDTELMNGLDSSNQRSSFSKSIYKRGFGLFSEEAVIGSTPIRVELIEQMSLDKFEEISNHGRVRMGYIDPNDRLDSESAIEPCDNQEKILDYYNTTPKSEFAEGNFGLWKLVTDNLNEEKLKNESGYLTYRFLVNCEAKAGWFVTEQLTLDYEDKVFDADLVDHLFQILYSVKTWKPAVLRGETKDAYLYITFRLENGELLEIIP